MQTTIDVLDNQEIAVTVRFKPNGNMLEREKQIQDAVNQVGALATKHTLDSFDADGRPLRFGDTTFYSRGQFNQTYETPYGPVDMKRHVYQSAKGGRTFVPLENRARLVKNATPYYAMQVTSKFVQAGAPGVKRDLERNHRRRISLDYIKVLADLVGTLAQTREADWEYEVPALPRPVKTISLGLDGTCMFMSHEGGWRQAMCGTISLYDDEGERMHTIYAGATPEYGKERFLARLDSEFSRTRALFPTAVIQGLADGAAENWTWLAERVDVEVLDFFHLSEYAGRGGDAIFPKDKDKRKAWVEHWLHRLKHEFGVVDEFLSEVRAQRVALKGERREALTALLRYAGNQRMRMGYAEERRCFRPIGSGVTEAACKVLIKERMCKSGMRWKREGASAVVALRSLDMTPGRWDQFWDMLVRYGVN